MIGRSSYYFQAPVGNPSYAGLGSASGAGKGGGLSALVDWSVYWTASGTMALAVAVLLAIKKNPVERPRVLIPAYGCPDLVAAIRYAGAEPIYVDMLEGTSNMDLRRVQEHIDDCKEVVAMIGVDLLGLPEDWPGLRRISDANDIFLLQDCAQSVQSQKTMLAELVGDAVIFSFGRGKPVCCLGGGALLLGSRQLDACNDVVTQLRETHNTMSLSFFRTRNSIYNCLIRPTAYALLAKLMGERLGETRYVSLSNIEFLSDATADQIDASVASYWSRHADKARQLFSALTPSIQGDGKNHVKWLENFNDTTLDRRLPRLPLLVNRQASRKRIIAALRLAGISSTTMYSRTLPEIVAEFDGHEKFERLPMAQSLAESLLTLPVHDRVSTADIERTKVVIDNEIH